MCMPSMKTPKRPEPVAQVLQPNKNAQVDVGPKKRKLAGKRIKRGNARSRLKIDDQSSPAGVNTATKGVGVYTGGGGGAYS
jgi:hypothetical protein